MELTVIIKQEDNLCLSIHIVAITRQCYLNFHMGIKFREFFTIAKNAKLKTHEI